jgi:hypothetical protein
MGEAALMTWPANREHRAPRLFVLRFGTVSFTRPSGRTVSAPFPAMSRDDETTPSGRAALGLLAHIKGRRL